MSLHIAAPRAHEPAEVRIQMAVLGGLRGGNRLIVQRQEGAARRGSVNGSQRGMAVPFEVRFSNGTVCRAVLPGIDR